MVRLKLIMVLAFQLLLSGCIASNKDTSGKVSGSSEHQIASSHALPQPISGVPDSAFSQETISDSEIANPNVYTIEHNATLYNYIGTVIDEVRLVKGGASVILASNVQSDSSVMVQWFIAEQYSSEPDGFSNCESPYFMIIVSEQEIPITVA